ncbi:hypothetical protein Avbf_12989, partial [Armadillidium vulgare]
DPVSSGILEWAFWDGTKTPVSCLQVIILNLLNRLTVSGKEDCLRLNVYTKVPNQRNKKFQ